MFLNILKEDAFLVMPGSSPKWTKHLHIKLLLISTLACFCKLGMDFFLVSYLWSFFPLFLLYSSNSGSGSILLLILYPSLRSLCCLSSGKGMMPLFWNISCLFVCILSSSSGFWIFLFYFCLVSYFPIL